MLVQFLPTVQTFLKNTMKEERLTALAVLSVKKEMVKQLEDFNERVIEKFEAKKGVELIFYTRHLCVSVITDASTSTEL